MLGRFARDTAIYGGAHLAGRVVNFLLLPVYARILAPQDFGAIDLTLALGAFALVTVALEVSQGLARAYPGAATAEFRAEQAGTALTFGGAAYAAFAAIAIPVSLLFGDRLVGRSDGHLVLAAGVGWVVLAGLLSIAQIPLRFGLRPKAYAASNLVLAVGSGLAALGLVGLAHMGPAGLLTGQAIGAALALVVTLAISRPRPTLRLSAPVLRTFLRFSLPLVPASVAIVAMAWVDRLAIAGLLTLADLGQYAVAVRVAAVIGLVVTAFQTAVIPLAYTYADEPSTRPALARLARVYALAAVVALVGLAWLGPEIVGVLAGPTFSDAVQLLPLVAAAPLLAGFANLAPGLAIARATRVMAAIAIAGAITTTALNLVLVPVLGLRGAALAAILGTGTALAATARLGQKHFDIPWPRIPLLASVVVGAAMAMAPSLLGADGPPSLAARTGLAAVAAIVIVASGLVRADDVLDVTRSMRRH